MTRPSPRGLLLGVALLALAAVVTALVSQHAYGIQPCPWCVLQRLIFVLVALCALLGLAWRRIGAGLALAFAVGGVAAALWQHFVAAGSAACNLTLADRLVAATGLDRVLPQVFAAYASCAEARVNLLGVPYEFYSLVLFALLCTALAAALSKRG